MTTSIVRPLPTPTYPPTPLPATMASPDWWQRRIADCGGAPPGTRVTVVSTTRGFLSLPAEIYHDRTWYVVEHGATIGGISNGEGFNPFRDQGCWQHYFEFDDSGRGETEPYAEFRVPSAISGVPEYFIRFGIALPRRS